MDAVAKIYGIRLKRIVFKHTGVSKQSSQVFSHSMHLLGSAPPGIGRNFDTTVPLKNRSVQIFLLTNRPAYETPQSLRKASEASFDG